MIYLFLAACIINIRERSLFVLSIIVFTVVLLDGIIPFDAMYGDHTLLLATFIDLAVIRIISRIYTKPSLCIAIFFSSAIALNLYGIIGVLYEIENLIIFTENGTSMIRFMELAVIILSNRRINELAVGSCKTFRDSVCNRLFLLGHNICFGNSEKCL